ncbi:hypothetical protein RJ640_023630 [Escallonia rubra]|uniref:CCHC-type domain-containing protein n=1 Tax=Escallonia rubra TaxID=112253 RepID=A0AA88UJH5_9ASTE|nr:hypothetical protein RJ640_023630 [Escallonia rubra]
MASDSNFVQAAIPRFDGHYDHWSMLMENFLRSKEYWLVVESGVGEPAKDAVMTDAQKTELEGRKLKDLKAKNYLFQAIDRSILETILSKETSKDIWDSMKKKYQGSSRVKRAQLQALRRDFEVLQMKDEEGVEVEVEVEEGEIEAIDGIRHFKADDDHYEGKGRGQDQHFDKSKVECFRCHKFGHYRSECYTKLPNDKEKGEKSNFVEKKEVETLLMVVQAHKEPAADVWYVDTGCSNHMCGSKSSFSYLNEDFHSTVSFGDFSTVNVMGKGDVKIRTKNGFVETISNVLYVPDLKSNLLSASQLQEKGYIITIQQGACEIYDPTKGAIVVVEMSSNRSPTFVVQDMTPEEAWSGQRPAVDHFRIFGCIAYAHVPYEKRKKLDDKSEKCVFLGVSKVSKAYKLFNPLTKKIVTGRDVVFEEEALGIGIGSSLLQLFFIVTLKKKCSQLQ